MIRERHLTMISRSTFDLLFVAFLEQGHSRGLNTLNIDTKSAFSSRQGEELRPAGIHARFSWFCAFSSTVAKHHENIHRIFPQTLPRSACTQIEPPAVFSTLGTTPIIILLPRHQKAAPVLGHWPPEAALFGHKIL